MEGRRKFWNSRRGSDRMPGEGAISIRSSLTSELGNNHRVQRQERGNGPGGGGTAGRMREGRGYEVSAREDNLKKKRRSEFQRGGV